jgi:hypothetical protein
MPKEPQSYGSGNDWVTGKTGQEVNDQASAPPAEHRDHYDSSHDTSTVPEQGGRTSGVQLADNAQNAAPASGASGANDATTRVTVKDGGAKRDSFFKKRDYE